MSIHYSAEAFTDVANRIVPEHKSAIVDRTFGLPVGLYVATFGFYFAFLAVMTLGFGSRETAVPLAICAIFLVMAFGVPRKWATMAPEKTAKATDWTDFHARGFDTFTGRIKARDATAQVLILPVLIFCWGLAIVVIAAML
jgi:hypothetical protein